MFTNIIAYAYEADLHCKDCTQKRFGSVAESTLDNAGNHPHPMFSYEEGNPEGEYCGDCQTLILPPWPHATDSDLEAFGTDRKTYEELRKRYLKGNKNV